MRGGKELVDHISDIHGHEPEWTLFPYEHDECPAFSTAKFVDVRSETIAALLPLSATDAQHFYIEVCENGIFIVVFCEYEDAPDGTTVYKS